MHEEKLIDRHEVLRILGIGKSELYRRIQSGEVPAGEHVGVVWRLEDIERLIAKEGKQ